MSSVTTATDELSVHRSFAIADRLAALLVLAFGLAIVYAVGFSPFAQAHNAAHDTRHANGFPCH